MTTYEPLADGAGVFAQGPENVQFAQYFTGRSYLTPGLDTPETAVSVSNVVFEPGCINHWHSHENGQVLVVTTGRGWHQVDGHEPQELHPGDVVQVAPHTRHWHGAARDTWFSHLAIMASGATDWQEPVEGYGDLP